jgi:hypothetical protein
MPYAPDLRFDPNLPAHLAIAGVNNFTARVVYNRLYMPPK